MITLFCIFAGIALIILSPFLFVLGLIILLLPICLVIWVLNIIANILLWKPKGPFEEETNIKQVNQNERNDVHNYPMERPKTNVE